MIGLSVELPKVRVEEKLPFLPTDVELVERLRGVEEELK
jgi:hypothetical protein